MFSKIKKSIKECKSIKKDIDLKNKSIKIKKNKFDEEWIRWGTKKSSMDKIM